MYYFGLNKGSEVLLEMYLERSGWGPPPPAPVSLIVREQVLFTAGVKQTITNFIPFHFC